MDAQNSGAISWPHGIFSALVAKLFLVAALLRCELDNESNNRPEWALIPLKGIKYLLEEK